jgi:hypothetical protein
MLNTERHEVALHIATRPFAELKALQEATGRTINYYTIHGTSRLMGRIIWNRWKAKTPTIPQDFPLQSFHEFPTIAFDQYCFGKPVAKSVETAELSIAQGKVLEIHPEWLFQPGTINQRGPYYGALQTILKIDEDIKSLVVRKKLFFRIASNPREHQTDVMPTETFLEKLKERGIDIFTFIERKWIKVIKTPQKCWVKTEDNVALLEVRTYDEWWDSIGKKTRNMVRKAEKSGIITKVPLADEKLAEGVWKIYNETPIRQGRTFSHYGVALANVRNTVLSAKDSTYIGAYLEDRLAGFIQLVYGHEIVIISQILSLQEQWDKAVNNALLAKAIQICATNQHRWLMYGRIGNHPSLDRFKENHGFKKFILRRFYVPLTTKGKIATKFGLHKEIRDTLPSSVKYALIPVYNWLNRTSRTLRRWR